MPGYARIPWADFFPQDGNSLVRSFEFGRFSHLSRLISFTIAPMLLVHPRFSKW
jgi:hypothetical protein